MNGKRTVDYVNKLNGEKGIPYIDVRLYKNYQEVFSYGVSDAGEVTGKERLFFFSATKPLTVVCAMRLVEEGKLALDDLVEKYLPAYANTYLEGEDGKFVPTKKKMTVRHLFTMSGGLSYNLQTSPIREAVRKTNGKADTLAAVSAFVETPLLFEPGERFEYSLCHDALAAVVEKVSGKRFSDFMAEVVFKPLEMTDSGFHLEEKGMYDMYDCDETGKIWQMKPYNRLILGENYDSGGAGVISNVKDYAKFAVALANGGIGENGYRLLKAETLAKITAAEHAEMQVKNTFTCVQGADYGYGLGVRVRMRDTEWGLSKGEFGWDGAAGTYLMVDPVRNISVVIGMHIMSWPHVFNGEHLKIVECLYKDLQAAGVL